MSPLLVFALLGVIVAVFGGVKVARWVYRIEDRLEQVEQRADAALLIANDGEAPPPRSRSLPR